MGSGKGTSLLVKLFPFRSSYHTKFRDLGLMPSRSGDLDLLAVLCWTVKSNQDDQDGKAWP